MRRYGPILMVLSTFLIVAACQPQTVVQRPLPPTSTLGPLTAEAYRTVEQELLEYLFESHLPRDLVVAQREEGQGGYAMVPCSFGPVVRQWSVKDKHHTIEFTILLLDDGHATIEYMESEFFPDLMTRAPKGIVANFDCYELELAKEPSGQWTTVSKQHTFRGHG